MKYWQFLMIIAFLGYMAGTITGMAYALRAIAIHIGAEAP